MTDQSSNGPDASTSTNTPTSALPKKKRVVRVITGVLVGAAAVTGALFALATRSNSPESDDEDVFEDTSCSDVPQSILCRDGWMSSSTGHGTCSSHGGIA